MVTILAEEEKRKKKRRKRKKNRAEQSINLHRAVNICTVLQCGSKSRFGEKGAGEKEGDKEW